jgi:hypothetical protein
MIIPTDMARNDCGNSQEEDIQKETPRDGEGAEEGCGGGVSRESRLVRSYGLGH